MSYLGENVRRYRKLRNYSITELAERSDCSPATISQIENDKRDATFKMLLSIASALNIHISQLVTPASETFYSHKVKSLLLFNNETYLLSGKAIDSSDNKITWLGIFKWDDNQIHLIELLLFNKPSKITVTFESIFQHSLKQYLEENYLTLLTSSSVYLDIDSSQINESNVAATDLIELAKSFYSDYL